MQASRNVPFYDSIAQKKADGWQYSYYPCPTRRKSATLCTGRSISDPVVGEFVFNYILNMLNAQSDFANINTPEELQQRLLSGDAFRKIVSIDKTGLNSFFNLLSSGNINGAIYGKGAGVAHAKSAQIDPEIVRLRKEKNRTCS